MTGVVTWLENAMSRVSAWWAKVPTGVKDVIHAAGKEIEQVAIALVEGEAVKVIDGETKLNNVGVDLIKAAKPAGYTLALDLTRMFGQEAYAATVGSTTPLAAGPDDPQDLHNTIAANNASAIAALVESGKVTTPNATA